MPPHCRAARRVPSAPIPAKPPGRPRPAHTPAVPPTVSRAPPAVPPSLHSCGGHKAPIASATGHRASERSGVARRAGRTTASWWPADGSWWPADGRRPTGRPGDRGRAGQGRAGIRRVPAHAAGPRYAGSAPCGRAAHPAGPADAALRIYRSFNCALFNRYFAPRYVHDNASHAVSKRSKRLAREDGEDPRRSRAAPWTTRSGEVTHARG
jgi:hypothetical protein